MAWETEATVTANQVVAYNLIRARRLRGLTQEEAGQRIAAHLGEPWHKATWSAAERSVAGERIRNFDADEILAFAQLFDVPVAWFFLPPADPDSWGAAEGVRGGGDPVPLDGLLRRAVRLNTPDMVQRIRELLPDSDPAEYLAAHVPAVTADDIAALERWEGELRGLADELGSQLGGLRDQLAETVAAYHPEQHEPQEPEDPEEGDTP